MCDKSGKQKPGYEKIKHCGEIAHKNNFKYFWADTCCIDKTSSAELTQAINSMYFWYQQAEVCYAYLADVPTPKEFAQSEWFTRGWTLQELIAPNDVLFFSKSWEEIGRKRDLVVDLSRITGIHEKALDPGSKMKQFSVAERMSWASKRVTTRIEDMAYCFMGIFDVNMPPLYGEREKSFIRLQEEIVKSSDDQSIFAWKDRNAKLGTYSGLLACSPKHFSDSRITSLGVWARSEPFSITNKGLKVQLCLEPMEQPGVYIASLDCAKSDQQGATIRIYLQRVSGLDTEWSQSPAAQFARIQCADPCWKLPDISQQNGEYRTIYVRQDQDLDFQRPEEGFESVRLIINGAPPSADRVYPLSQWNPRTGLFQMRRADQIKFSGIWKAGAFSFHQSEVDYLVVFGTQSGGLWNAAVKIDICKDNCFERSFEGYTCTENDTAEWYLDEGWGKSHLMTKLEISAVARRGEHFKTPIWIVEVKSAEVPRYTPQELGQRERAKKNRNEQRARQGLGPEPSHW
jgi:hypothetical protein